MDKPIHPNSWTGKVLMFLTLQEGDWCTWGPGFYMSSVQQVFPVGTREETQFRFMRMLQYKGLVSGCDCGCRGDYTPTEKGLEFMESESLYGEQEAKIYRNGNFGYGY